MADLSRPAALAPRGAARPIGPAAFYLLRCAEASRPTMRSALQQTVRLLTRHLGAAAGTFDFESFPWAALQPEHVAAIRAALAATYKPTTANHRLAALRGVVRAMFAQKIITADDRDRLLAEASDVRGETKPTGRMLPEDEVGRLFAAAGGGRDRALLAAALYCGLRRDELRRLDVADYTGRLLRVLGKGSKYREVAVAAPAQLHLDAWIATMRALGHTGGALFPRANGWHRLTASGVAAVLREIAVKAGVAFTPHDLRRTFASTLLDRGADLSTVADLLGHADIRTTRKYDRRGEKRKRAAVDLLADAWSARGEPSR